MQSLERGGYTREEVIEALHAASRTLDFRYDLLTNQNILKKRLTNVLSASVANNALAEIKRTARFSLVEDGTINFLTDRIKPWVRLRLPPRRIIARGNYFLMTQFPAELELELEEEEGGFVEFPQGVFLLSTPPRIADSAGIITREVEAYDQLQVLIDDKVEDRYTVGQGTNYVVAVKALLDGAGIVNQNLTPTASTLPVVRDWEPGTSKKIIINDLLGAINYRSLWFDENGVAVAMPYVSPADRASEYTYEINEESVILPGAVDSLDLFAIPNKWVLVVSEPDRAPLTSVYTNENPNSPTSTVSRGRTIVDYREYEAADQATLNARAERVAFESSQVYQQVIFETGIAPYHSDSDILTLIHPPLGIASKFSEVAWEYDLRPGAVMKHRLRRIVNI